MQFIALSNKAEFNAVLAGLRLLYEHRLRPDKSVFIPEIQLNDILTFEVDEGLTIDEIYKLGTRINTVTYLCDCGNEFDGLGVDLFHFFVRAFLGDLAKPFSIRIIV